MPALVPDLKDLRRDLAIRRGQDPPLDHIDERHENENELEDDIEVVKTAPNDSRSSWEIEKETIYMGIVTTDSTVVYYKLTKGIKKPADIPDE